MAYFSLQLQRFYCYSLTLFISASNFYCFQLTILHTNDVHARIEETNKYGGPCSDSDSKAGLCYGGVGRRFTKIKEIRRNESNVLLLDGGDQFQGTFWFNVYKGIEASIFMNELKYDAMALGNHEFDKGVEGVLPFLQHVNFPILCANIITNGEPLWPKGKILYQKSKIFDVGQEKIGVIGYLSRDTIWLALPGPNLKFTDEIEAIRREVVKLKKKNITKIIALGHSGIDMDVKIAHEIPDLDIVIGGHTNTFMYTGSPPSNDVPYSSYPLLIRPKSQPSKKILVVQAFTFGKYLGYLNVTFDNMGNVIDYNGNPILLNSAIPQDAGIMVQVNNMSSAIQKQFKVPVGRSYVFLDGRRDSCRLRECNLGNLITDALVHMNHRIPDDRNWADVSLAMWNGGIIRSSVDKKINESVTYGDIVTILPFGNTADIVEIKGEHLLQVLEHSVTQYSYSNPSGRFMQYSGFVVKYDLDREEGKRVVSCKVRCAQCRIPKFEPLNNTKIYKVIAPRFVVNGGDDFQVFVKHTIKRHIGNVAASLLASYFESESPITAGLEGRIEFVSTPTSKPSPPSNIVNGNTAISLQPPILLLYVMILLMKIFVL